LSEHDDEPLQRARRIVEPGQQQPYVDEVELRVGQVVRHDVVCADDQVRPRQLAQHRRFQVGGDDRAVGADPVGQP
jgi:hypothetical protein